MTKAHYIDFFKQAADKKIQWLKEELTKIRTGRPNPKIFDNLLIESYGQKMPLISLAQVTINPPREIIIKPFDPKSNTNAIYSEIQRANIGVQPVIDGEKIRVNFPQITQETRLENIKHVKKIIEQIYQELRVVRRDALQMIKKDNHNEDLENSLKAEIEKINKNYSNQLEEIQKDKEKELLTI
ncbi:ribosome recycling factor [Mycoplasmoides genitalium]|uniref:Ribosome-recycling factor n=1 Tax=Mycoplasma genitalium (strain ATCC 33530 / DSM 19775 / NCTC 10195 / G37) TaxID=243273 RepID=RRF_MYCGE|nr:ribosome recycling factor [Mycoplasmoides genitalium]P47673.1 RecName: Full=Ribosome-recycling factor; Short=RRF; AltName: Full=Ribosome-releasing factor [Mycoplasmoides genitalium G37]ABY79663.1 ribosome recycling factor [synthetic Mycoplasma genitalium JCVI-1.0]AAC72456.1 ribosome recycling factor [Mycoplasmoides genitalium G37]AFQ03272.1 ribosome recycling factor [Mycoplasmoides genitalium M2321]AFQ03759.1 ribosome recycling factor [Mycoplasmoides genitalium M6282]AFQ04772.1 ribosome re